MTAATARFFPERVFGPGAPSSLRPHGGTGKKHNPVRFATMSVRFGGSAPLVQFVPVPRRRIVLDHLTIGVSDLAASRAFYARALTPLGFAEIGPWRDGGREIAFGLEEAADFAISTEYGTGAPVHVAFAADRREQVDAFHAAALAAGGRDNGPPGLRPDGYYGAFVLDPDGHNIEAVHHGR
jgi:catechol 2,3-dioxygenase-like lactoylglutathione lyase family enzyme